MVKFSRNSYCSSQITDSSVNEGAEDFEFYNFKFYIFSASFKIISSSSESSCIFSSGESYKICWSLQTFYLKLNVSEPELSEPDPMSLSSLSIYIESILATKPLLSGPTTCAWSFDSLLLLEELFKDSVTMQLSSDFSIYFYLMKKSLYWSYWRAFTVSPCVVMSACSWLYDWFWKSYLRFESAVDLAIYLQRELG